jgi:hypothetical protein
VSKVIGFRAEPGALNWAFLEGSSRVPVLNFADKLAAPATYGEAQALCWYRTQTLQLIEQFGPDAVVVRAPETFGRGPARDADHRRSRIEGILMEVACAQGLRVETATLATISSNLETRSAKAYLDNKVFRGLDWDKRPKNVKEAILVAVSFLGD